MDAQELRRRKAFYGIDGASQQQAAMVQEVRVATKRLTAPEEE